MKKILALVLGLVILASCSSDDNDNAIDASKLTDKKWYGVSFTVLGQTFLVENDYPNCNRDYIMFKTGGVFESSYHEPNCDEFVDLGTWTIVGNTITSDEDGDITNAIITKVSDTQLQVSTQEDVDEDGKMETVLLLLSTN